MNRQLEAALIRARRLARGGNPLPLDLYAFLLGNGIDVEALERNPNG